MGVSLPLPEGGLVYDYRIEDGGLFCSTGPGKKGEEEEEEEKGKGKTKVLFYVCLSCATGWSVGLVRGTSLMRTLPAVPAT